jgi:hypothetical protein
MPLSMSNSRRAVENLVSAYNEIQQDPCHGLIQSAAADGIGDRTSREGGCGEYAVADRLIGRLKRERIAHRDGAIRRDVSDDERDGAEMCYNSTRAPLYCGPIEATSARRHGRPLGPGCFTGYACVLILTGDAERR